MCAGSGIFGAERENALAESSYSQINDGCFSEAAHSLSKAGYSKISGGSGTGGIQKDCMQCFF